MLIKGFTQWLNEEEEYSTKARLADVEHLYSLGMAHDFQVALLKIRLRHEAGSPEYLTRAETELMDDEGAEDIQNWVEEEALNWTWEFSSDAEEAAFTEVSSDFIFDVDWAIYPDGSIQVAIGADAPVEWTDDSGKVHSRSILYYFKEPIHPEINTTLTTGDIDPWPSLKDDIISIVNDTYYLYHK